MMSAKQLSPADRLTRFFAEVLQLRYALRTSLFSNAFFFWSSQALIGLSGFIFWALAAFFYDAEDIGRGSAAVAALMLLAMIAQLGLGLGLIRFVPESGQRAPILVNSSLTVAMLASVGITSIFLAGLSLWSPELIFLRNQPLYGAAFVVFAVSMTLTILQDYVLMALRSGKYILIRACLTNLTRVLLVGVLAFFFAAFGIVAATGIAACLGLALGYAFLHRAQPAYGPALVLDREPIIRLFPFAIGNYAADFAVLAPSMIVPIMVVNVLGAEEGGYFYVGWFMGYVLFAVSYSVALSLFAEGSYDEAALPKLTRRALAVSLAVVGAGVVLVLLAGDKLLLVFGEDYSQQASGVLRMVAVATLLAAVTNIYLGIERVRKRIGPLVAVSSLVGLTTCGVSYALLPGLGILGAGVGMLTGQALGAAIGAARLAPILTREPSDPGQVGSSAVDGSAPDGFQQDSS